jgi:hypothetical protein
MTIDVLHPLIHSLSKSEKRYCRLMAGRQGGDKGFLRLLDALLRHEQLGDNLTADLATAFPDQTVEPARKYLYRVVMQSLRQFEQHKRVDVRIGQLLHDSQILYERGLMQFSQSQLVKAQRLAERHERSLYAILATRQQLEQGIRGQFDGLDEATLANQHAFVRTQLERTQTALNHAALYETLLLRYQTKGTVSSSAETLRLNDLLLEEYQLLNRQKQRSFAMQQQHLHFQSAYFRMIGDGAGSLRVYRELDDLFQANGPLWAEQPFYYVQLLEGILFDLRMLAQYNEMPYFIDRLRAISTPVQGLYQPIHYSTLYYSLLMRVDQGQYAEAGALLQTVPQAADQALFDKGLNQLALPARLDFNLLLVRIDVGNGQLSAGLQRLNRVLALPGRSLPRTLYVQTRLMNLLVHARLGNADYLNYAVRSISRKLHTMGAPAPGERLILSLLDNWLAGRLDAAALSQIDTFAGSPADRQLLRNLDLRAWATAVQT